MSVSFLDGDTSFASSTRPCFEMISSIVFTLEAMFLKTGPLVCDLISRAGTTSASAFE